MKLQYFARMMFFSVLGYILTLTALLLGTELNEWLALGWPPAMLWFSLTGMPLGALFEMRGGRR